jgi:hypothetical protein
MTAALPTIAVVFFPDHAKVSGETLTDIAVTGHAVVKIEVLAEVELGRVGRQGRNGQRVVGRGRSGGLGGGLGKRMGIGRGGQGGEPGEQQRIEGDEGDEKYAPGGHSS